MCLIPKEELEAMIKEQEAIDIRIDAMREQQDIEEEYTTRTFREQHFFEEYKNNNI
jgi:hypothetical protein